MRLQTVGKSWLIAVIALVGVVVLSGCAPRVSGGETAQAAAGDATVVDLPAIVVDFDLNGTPFVGDLPLSEFGPFVGEELANFTLSTDWIDFAQRGNIQHVQIDNAPTGLMLLVNGQPVPSLVWDGETLLTTANILDDLQVNVPMLDELLPIISNVGVGATVRFPLADGVETIPLARAENSALAQQAEEAQAAFLETVQSPPQLRVVVNYDNSGKWTVADLSQEEWTVLTGLPWELFNLPPDMIVGLVDGGIEKIDLSSTERGMFVSINDQTLPYLTWESGEILNVIALSEQLGLLRSVLGDDPNMNRLLVTVEQLLPLVQAADIDITVRFP